MALSDLVVKQAKTTEKAYTLPDIDGLSLTGVGGMRSLGGGAWINVMQEREYVRTRVEFLNGVVFALEEMAKEQPKP